MITGRILLGAFIATTVGVATILFIRTTAPDLQRHLAVQTTLAEIAKQEEVLKRDVLRMRSSLLSTYDPLVAATRHIDSLVGVLTEGPIAPTGTSHAELDRLIDDYAAAAAARQDRLERFKAKDVVFKNSLVYFPRLVRDLIDQARAAGSDPALALAVGRLHGDLLADYAAGRLGAGRLDSQIEILTALSDGAPALLREGVAVLVRHARIILAKDAVDALVGQLLAGDESRILDDLTAAFRRHSLATRASVQRDAAALYAVSILLLGCVALIFLRLVQARASLRTANASLEQRVSDRTEALQASESRFSGILDMAPEAVISTDETQCITLFNKGAEAIFGYAANEVMGRPVDTLIPTGLRVAHGRHVDNFVRDRGLSRLAKQRRDIYGLRKDGTEFPAAASVSKLIQGATTAYTVMLRDISDRKKAEEAILTAKEQAEFANRAKSEFLANMSHELRTPLNGIIGFSDIIQRETWGPIGNDKYAEYAGDIKSAGTHLLAVINDILDLSKIESGKTELHEEVVDTTHVLASCLTLIKERAQVAGVAIACEPAPDLPALHGDERKLKQILVNLLSNAVKFTPKGGQVTVRAWFRAGGGFVFQVSDTGVGIAPEDIPKALAPFHQVDSALNRKYEGTGLGLPLTKSLVELHGGSLDLQSEVGVGTTVTLRFRAWRVDMLALNARRPDRPAPGPPAPGCSAALPAQQHMWAAATRTRSR